MGIKITIAEIMLWEAPLWTRPGISKSKSGETDIIQIKIVLKFFPVILVIIFPDM